MQRFKKKERKHTHILINGIFSTTKYSFTLDLVTRTTVWNTMSCFFCIWIVHVGFSQSCVQRLIALPTLSDAKKSMVIFFFGVALIMTFTCGTGIIMYAYYYDCDPITAKIVSRYDKLIPRFVQDVAGHITGMTGSISYIKS